jgi:glycerol-3-phosphate O-acyltransferase / dihydroxyacetone phosphate acyltransferase
VRRLIAWIGRFAAALLFRRVEVAGKERYPAGRPVLLVANHFNGFVDPVLITSAMGRTPRFVAKATLQGIPLAGWLLRRVGVVFVHRQVDAGGADGNESAFHECHRALVERDVVAIFPEGTTHDRPRMDPIKTGAARIALGARAAGATRLAIVPVGLTFPDKVALRSSALVPMPGCET